MNKKLDDLTGWINFNYLGLAAGILSVVVTLYNINKYVDEIKRTQKQIE